MTLEAQRSLSPGASPDASPERFSGAILGRVESLTLILGALATVLAAWRWGWRGAVGLAIGTLLSWINFRWLKGSVKAFGRVSVATGPGSAQGAPADTSPAAVTPVRVSKAAYFKFIGRYVLLLGGVYVILTRTSLPAVAVLAGLFAAAAAVVVGIFYELILTGVRTTLGRES